MTTNLDRLIEIVIDGVKYRMVPLGDGDMQPKTMEVVKKQTPIRITEKKKVIDEILKVPVMTKKPSISCVSKLPQCISLKQFQDIVRKKEQE